MTTPAKGRHIQPAEGKLGVLLPGMGAVATTFMAGVEAIRTGPVEAHRQPDPDGHGPPRQAHRQPLAPHQGLRAPRRARGPRLRRLGHLHRQRLRGREARRRARQRRTWPPLKAFLETRQALAGGLRPAVREEAPRGRTSRRGRASATSPTRSRPTSRGSRRRRASSRLVMVWCGSTEVYREAGEVHSSLAKFEKGLDESHPDILPSMIYAYCAIKAGIPYANGAPNLSGDFPAMLELAKKNGHAHHGQGLQDRPDLHEDAPRPGLQGAPAGHERLVLDQHPGQPRRRGAGRPRVVQDQGSLEARRARAHPPAAALPRPLRQDPPRGAHQLLPAPRRQQGRLGQHRHLRVDGLPDADQGRLPLPRLDPGRAPRARPRALPRPRRRARA